jgi:mono/diheme cytochrome c family protein
MNKFSKQAKLATLALAALAVALAGGCRGDRQTSRPRQFLPDMDDSPKFKPQTQTPFFADGRSMRAPVTGTVAFGVLPDPKAPGREHYLKEDDAFFRGKASDGAFLAKIPPGVTIDRAALERGQERYNVFCASCHGYDGKGKGTVGAVWSYGLPNFLDPKYWDAKNDPEKSRDGYIFHVIRNGVAGPDGALKMPAYGYSIRPEDAWKIVAYIRAIQAASFGKLEDLPEAERQKLLQNRPTTPSGQGGSTSTGGSQ